MRDKLSAFPVPQGARSVRTGPSTLKNLGTSLIRHIGGSVLSESDRGMSQQQVQLKVLEAYTRDVGRGVARIDYDAMDALDASTGDVIEIRGKRRTVAKCLPPRRSWSHRSKRCPRSTRGISPTRSRASRSPKVIT